MLLFILVQVIVHFESLKSLAVRELQQRYSKGKEPFVLHKRSGLFLAQISGGEVRVETLGDVELLASVAGIEMDVREAPDWIQPPGIIEL